MNPISSSEPPQTPLHPPYQPSSTSSTPASSYFHEADYIISILSTADPLHNITILSHTNTIITMINQYIEQSYLLDSHLTQIVDVLLGKMCPIILSISNLIEQHIIVLNHYLLQLSTENITENNNQTQRKLFTPTSPILMSLFEKTMNNARTATDLTANLAMLKALSSIFYNLCKVRKIKHISKFVNIPTAIYFNSIVTLLIISNNPTFNLILNQSELIAFHQVATSHSEIPNKSDITHNNTNIKSFLKAFNQNILAEIRKNYHWSISYSLLAILSISIITPFPLHTFDTLSPVSIISLPHITTQTQPQPTSHFSIEQLACCGETFLSLFQLTPPQPIQINHFTPISTQITDGDNHLPPPNLGHPKIIGKCYKFSQLSSFVQNNSILILFTLPLIQRLITVLLVILSTVSPMQYIAGVVLGNMLSRKDIFNHKNPHHPRNELNLNNEQWDELIIMKQFLNFVNSVLYEYSPVEMCISPNIILKIPHTLSSQPTGEITSIHDHFPHYAHGLFIVLAIFLDRITISTTANESTQERIQNNSTNPNNSHSILYQCFELLSPLLITLPASSLLSTQLKPMSQQKTFHPSPQTPNKPPSLRQVTGLFGALLRSTDADTQQKCLKNLTNPNSNDLYPPFTQNLDDHQILSQHTLHDKKSTLKPLVWLDVSTSSITRKLWIKCLKRLLSLVIHQQFFLFSFKKTGDSPENCVKTNYFEIIIKFLFITLSDTSWAIRHSTAKALSTILKHLSFLPSPADSSSQVLEIMYKHNIKHYILDNLILLTNNILYHKSKNNNTNNNLVSILLTYSYTFYHHLYDSSPPLHSYTSNYLPKNRNHCTLTQKYNTASNLHFVKILTLIIITLWYPNNGSNTSHFNIISSSSASASANGKMIIESALLCIYTLSRSYSFQDLLNIVENYNKNDHSGPKKCLNLTNLLLLIYDTMLFIILFHNDKSVKLTCSAVLQEFIGRYYGRFSTHPGIKDDLLLNLSAPTSPNILPTSLQHINQHTFYTLLTQHDHNFTNYQLDMLNIQEIVTQQLYCINSSDCGESGQPPQATISLSRDQLITALFSYFPCDNAIYFSRFSTQSTSQNDITPKFSLNNPIFLTTYHISALDVLSFFDYSNVMSLSLSVFTISTAPSTAVGTETSGTQNNQNVLYFSPAYLQSITALISMYHETISKKGNTSTVPIGEFITNIITTTLSFLSTTIALSYHNNLCYYVYYLLLFLIENKIVSNNVKMVYMILYLIYYRLSLSTNFNMRCFAMVLLNVIIQFTLIQRHNLDISLNSPNIHQIDNAVIVTPQNVHDISILKNFENNFHYPEYHLFMNQQRLIEYKNICSIIYDHWLPNALQPATYITFPHSQQQLQYFDKTNVLTYTPMQLESGITLLINLLSFIDWNCHNSENNSLSNYNHFNLFYNYILSHKCNTNDSDIESHDLMLQQLLKYPIAYLHILSAPFSHFEGENNNITSLSSQINGWLLLHIQLLAYIEMLVLKVIKTYLLIIQISQQNCQEQTFSFNDHTVSLIDQMLIFYFYIAVSMMNHYNTYIQSLATSIMINIFAIIPLLARIIPFTNTISQLAQKWINHFIMYAFYRIVPQQFLNQITQHSNSPLPSHSSPIDQLFLLNQHSPQIQTITTRGQLPFYQLNEVLYFTTIPRSTPSQQVQSTFTQAPLPASSQTSAPINRFNRFTKPKLDGKSKQPTDIDNNLQNTSNSIPNPFLSSDELFLTDKPRPNQHDNPSVIFKQSFYKWLTLDSTNISHHIQAHFENNAGNIAATEQIFKTLSQQSTIIKYQHPYRQYLTNIIPYLNPNDQNPSSAHSKSDITKSPTNPPKIDNFINLYMPYDLQSILRLFYHILKTLLNNNTNEASHLLFFSDILQQHNQDISNVRLIEVLFLLASHPSFTKDIIIRSISINGLQMILQYNKNNSISDTPPQYSQIITKMGQMLQTEPIFRAQLTQLKTITLTNINTRSTLTPPQQIKPLPSIQSSQPQSLQQTLSTLAPLHIIPQFSQSQKPQLLDYLLSVLTINAHNNTPTTFIVLPPYYMLYNSIYTYYSIIHQIITNATESGQICYYYYYKLLEVCLIHYNTPFALVKSLIDAVTISISLEMRHISPHNILQTSNTSLTDPFSMQIQMIQQLIEEYIVNTIKYHSNLESIEQEHVGNKTDYKPVLCQYQSWLHHKLSHSINTTPIFWNESDFTSRNDDSISNRTAHSNLMSLTYQTYFSHITLFPNQSIAQTLYASFSTTGLKNSDKNQTWMNLAESLYTYYNIYTVKMYKYLSLLTTQQYALNSHNYQIPRYNPLFTTFSSLISGYSSNSSSNSTNSHINNIYYDPRSIFCTILYNHHKRLQKGTFHDRVRTDCYQYNINVIMDIFMTYTSTDPQLIDLTTLSSPLSALKSVNFKMSRDNGSDNIYNMTQLSSIIDIMANTYQHDTISKTQSFSTQSPNGTNDPSSNANQVPSSSPQGVFFATMIIALGMDDMLKNTTESCIEHHHPFFTTLLSSLLKYSSDIYNPKSIADASNYNQSTISIFFSMLTHINHIIVILQNYFKYSELIQTQNDIYNVNHMMYRDFVTFSVQYITFLSTTIKFLPLTVPNMISVIFPIITSINGVILFHSTHTTDVTQLSQLINQLYGHIFPVIASRALSVSTQLSAKLMHPQQQPQIINTLKNNKKLLLSSFASIFKSFSQYSNDTESIMMLLCQYDLYKIFFENIIDDRQITHHIDKNNASVISSIHSVIKS